MADDLEDAQRRVEDLRDFEREYRARLRAYLTEQLAVLGTLTDDQREQVERARWYLETARDKLEVTSHLRALLAVVDELASRGSDG